MDEKNVENPNIIDKVTKEWWSEDMAETRKYFFERFVEKERPTLLTKDLKELKGHLPKSEGKVMKLCYFYDRIGFLCASKIIDEDEILPPMLHSMRKTWLAMKHFVDKYREPNDEYFDPIYMCAFEWLFNKSNEYYKSNESVKNPSHLYVELYGGRFAEEHVQLDENLRRTESNFEKRLAEQEKMTKN